MDDDRAGEDIRIIQGDAVEVMRTLPDRSIDAIISDPIYPEIDRSYGRISEADWHVLMRGVVGEARRVLKPHGSAVFILQPNYETPGRIRPWLWEFMAWTAREWNMVQDAYWLNTSALPTAGCQRQYGLMRPSIKPCVWLGPIDCYRDQEAVLWSEAESSKINRMADRYKDVREGCPSGKANNRASLCRAVEERGGTTPYNVFPISTRSAEFGERIHAAPTPVALADWWTRYITRPGDTILDPFSGSGTMPLAAQARGRKAIGIERDPGYVEISRRRIEAAKLPMFDRVASGQETGPVTARASVSPPMFAFADEADTP